MNKQIEFYPNNIVRFNFDNGHSVRMQQNQNGMVTVVRIKDRREASKFETIGADSLADYLKKVCMLKR